MKNGCKQYKTIGWKNNAKTKEDKSRAADVKLMKKERAEKWTQLFPFHTACNVYSIKTA